MGHLPENRMEYPGEMKRDTQECMNDTYLGSLEQHPAPASGERCGPIYAESPGIRR